MSMPKVFLLEDDTILNDTITEYLEDNGYEVVSVYDGFEAQEKLYESKFDILLLDINVPNINGLELLKECR
jgi:DNA-binding response OmpR family regulator